MNWRVKLFFWMDFQYCHPLRANLDKECQMGKLLSKSEMIEKIAAEHSELSKKQVKGVIESLATVGYKELKKNGAFVVPGFAKFVVIKKPATKERKGINPFTKEPTVFKAKPARKNCLLTRKVGTEVDTKNFAVAN